MVRSKYFQISFEVTPDTKLMPAVNPFFNLEGVKKIIVSRTGSFSREEYITLVRGNKKERINYNLRSYCGGGYPKLNQIRFEKYHQGAIVRFEITSLRQTEGPGLTTPAQG